MLVAGGLLFDALVGALFSFATAALLVVASRRVLRLPDGRLALALVLLPVVKVLLEIARGVPSGAYFWARMDHVTRDVGSFIVGFGLRPPLVPVIHVSLGAVVGDRTYPDSAADVLAAFLARTLSPSAPALIGFALAMLGAVRLVRWAIGTWQGTPSQARVQRDGHVIDVQRLGWRRVPVFVSEEYEGAPFAAGILRPYVCLPKSLDAELTRDERRAVVLHELAHLRFFDVFAVVVAGAAEAFFWFVPFLGYFAREARAQCEIAADTSAVRHGADRRALASALVRVAETIALNDRLPPVLALGSSAPLLVRRVGRLMDAPASERRWVVVLRLAVALLVVVTVLKATTLGYP